MISHVIIISYIALPHAHAHFDWASASPHRSSAAEIFNFRLIRVHSNARNSILSFQHFHAILVRNTSVCKSVSFIFAVKFDLGHVPLETTLSAATSFGSHGSRFSKAQISNNFRLKRGFPENGSYTSYNHVT